MNRIYSIKQDIVLFCAECARALKLLTVYPLETVNSIVSFVVISVIFMAGIKAAGSSSQIFGVVFFPIMLNLLGGPASSIRNDVEMGVFEQVYISGYPLIKIAVIRSVVSGTASCAGSIIIAVIMHLFFVRISFPVLHFFLLFFIFGIQSILAGVILAGITLRFRRTETLLNSINLLLMIFLVMPLLDISHKTVFLPSVVCPFWGIVTYYQQLLTGDTAARIFVNFSFTAVNTVFLAFAASAIYSRLLYTAKEKGCLGQY